MAADSLFAPLYKYHGITLDIEFIEEHKQDAIIGFHGPFSLDVLDQFAPAANEIPLTWRYALQTLGTEWGRNLIAENIWIETLAAELVTATNMGNLNPEFGKFVVSDLRFANELEGINRLGVVKQYSHASEAEIIELQLKADCIFTNDSTIERLVESVTKELHQYP